MRADILPSLSVAAALDMPAVIAAWAKARDTALAQNRGRDDSRTYVLTLETFRKAHPFDYSSLGVSQQGVPTPRATNGPDSAATSSPY